MSTMTTSDGTQIFYEDLQSTAPDYRRRYLIPTRRV